MPLSRRLPVRLPLPGVPGAVLLVMLLAAACSGLQVALASGRALPAATGTGSAPQAAGAPLPAASAAAAHRLQRQRCMALAVAAVRQECLRQAERDLALEQARAASKPHPPRADGPPRAQAASSASAGRRP